MEINTLILSKNQITNELIIEFILNKNILNTIINNRFSNKKYYILTLDKLPKYFLEFQSCFNVVDWSAQEPQFIIENISKAKEIQKDKFRVARKPILEKLDVEYMRALEAGDTQKQQEIASKKQALRDITNTSLPDDLEDIKNTWPDILNS